MVAKELGLKLDVKLEIYVEGSSEGRRAERGGGIGKTMGFEERDLVNVDIICIDTNWPEHCST